MGASRKIIRRFQEKLEASGYTDQEEVQRLIAERDAQLARLPVKATYQPATIGAKTERGGVVMTASTQARLAGHRVACINDLVTYPDGTTARIVSGAGSSIHYMGRPWALVGSEIDNGDTIVASPQPAGLFQMRELVDEPIPGLLQPGYLAPYPTQTT